jgi:hypothetical protein
LPEDGAAGMDGVPAAEAGALAAGVEAAGALAADVLLDELEHAAASNEIGIKAVTVQTNRILLATGGHSFTRCTLKRAVAISHAGACEQRTAARRGQKAR